MSDTVPTYGKLIEAEFGPGCTLIESKAMNNGWLLIISRNTNTLN